MYDNRNTNRWSRGLSDPEELAFEAARLHSSMEEIATYINMYGRDPVTIETDRYTIIAPAYEAFLRHYRRLSNKL